MTRSADPSPERAAAIRRAIPKVDRLLDAEEMRPLLAAHSRAEVVREVRRVLDELPGDAHRLDAAEAGVAAVSRRVAQGLARRAQPYYRRVVNATGVVLHTGIGRAVLAPEAVAALADLPGHAQRLGIDLATGDRGGGGEGGAAPLRGRPRPPEATRVHHK